jgi:hypothetical protein
MRYSIAPWTAFLRRRCGDGEVGWLVLHRLKQLSDLMVRH